MRPCAPRRTSTSGFRVGNAANVHQTLTMSKREKIKDDFGKKVATQRKYATIKEIASLIGILGDAAMYFPWAKAQLLVLTALLRMCIRWGYHRAKAIMARRPSTVPITVIDRVI